METKFPEAALPFPIPPYTFPVRVPPLTVTLLLLEELSGKKEGSLGRLVPKAATGK
jgi:hypothetical protein